MRGLMIVAALSVHLFVAPAGAAPLHPVIRADPPRNAAHPAFNKQLLIPSHGVGMNALLLVAAGKGPHPTVLLMHGLPGNERNLDLAQAIRRAGWNTLTFTYRGAWGSPGDFSIASAMEDTTAALAFSRSAEGEKLGIDPRHIVLAGHSMGGAMAALTSAQASGVDGLILLDAWNISDTARKTPRNEVVAGLDDLGNALHGATPESVADEIIARGAEWDLVKAAPRLAKLPILTVTATHGGAVENRPVTAALRTAGNRRVTAVELDTDHAFADHRIKLQSTVVRWLQALGR